jgi:hypothetical protein
MLKIFSNPSHVFTNRSLWLHHYNVIPRSVRDSILPNERTSPTFKWKTEIINRHVHYDIKFEKSSNKRQRVVFALLVPSCQQVWNKLLTTCNNLIGTVRFVARLFQQVRYSHDITILLHEQASLVDMQLRT